VHGAVAAGHPITAEAGARVLADGGNAIDALLTAAFSAFVAEGPLTGATGGGFLLVHEPDGATTVLDCFFAVPKQGLGPMDEVVIDFADAGTQTFNVGAGSVAVPGLLPGLVEAHRRFASRPWPALVAPAIGLARAGFIRDEQRAFLHGILAPILLREDGGRRVYGDPKRVVTAEVGAVLERIRDDGAEAVTDLLPEFAEDLGRYRVETPEPLRATVNDVEVLATPAPSRGGAIVLEILTSLAAESGSATDVARAVGLAYGASAGRLTGTTHISVVDADGLAAALSSTLGSGSGVFRSGCQLNNMLGELDVIGGAARDPGSRLPSMMTPTLVLDGGRPRLVLGSAGSVRLAGAIAQVAWHVLGGMPVAAAIDAPRLHVDDGVVHLEGGWSDADVERLGDSSTVVRWSGLNLFFGGVAAVERRPDGTLAAAGDPRRGGHGVVV
jgi:gamma-glutamyltranspeptidase/glutathione hydrolase